MSAYGPTIVPVCPECGASTDAVPCCPYGDRSRCPACGWQVGAC